jgi:hypothetical protein
MAGLTHLSQHHGLCLVIILCPHRRITLPLFERGWQSLKLTLRHYSLPKVQFATKTLPKDFSERREKRQSVFACKNGPCSRLYNGNVAAFWGEEFSLGPCSDPIDLVSVYPIE